MGVERAVTRWYAQRQLLLEEIARLEGKLADPPDANQGTQDNATGADAVDRQTVQTDLAKAWERLRLLGHCPQPMMG